MDKNNTWAALFMTATITFAIVGIGTVIERATEVIGALDEAAPGFKGDLLTMVGLLVISVAGFFLIRADINKHEKG